MYKALADFIEKAGQTADLTEHMMDIISSAGDNMKRIADALEIIAAANYLGNDMGDKDRLDREADQAAKAAAVENDLKLREEVLTELIALKIPYSREMGTEQLQKRLVDAKAQIAAKEIEANAAAAASEKKRKEDLEQAKKEAKVPPTTPKAPAKTEAPKAPVTPPPAKTTGVPTPGDISNEDMKGVLIEAVEVIGDPETLALFNAYKFSAKCTSVASIPQADRPAWMDYLKGEIAKAKGASTSDMAGLLG